MSAYPSYGHAKSGYGAPDHFNTRHSFYRPPPQQRFNGYASQQHSPQPYYCYHQQALSKEYAYQVPQPTPYTGDYNQSPRQPNHPTCPGANYGMNPQRPVGYGQRPGQPSSPLFGLQQLDQIALQGYAFQYSNCTGRRKALLIGINYVRQHGQLRGCIKDVRNMTAYLAANFGYNRENMVILTDDQQNPMSQPTKQNILRAMHWLVKDARPNGRTNGCWATQCYLILLR